MVGEAQLAAESSVVLNGDGLNARDGAVVVDQLAIQRSLSRHRHGDRHEGRSSRGELRLGLGVRDKRVLLAAGRSSRVGGRSETLEVAVNLWSGVLLLDSGHSRQLVGSGRAIVRRERGEARVGSALMLVRVSTTARRAGRLGVEGARGLVGLRHGQEIK